VKTPGAGFIVKIHLQNARPQAHIARLHHHRFWDAGGKSKIFDAERGERE
jgi:hypothetical protein